MQVGFLFLRACFAVPCGALRVYRTLCKQQKLHQSAKMSTELKTKLMSKGNIKTKKGKLKHFIKQTQFSQVIWRVSRYFFFF